MEVQKEHVVLGIDAAWTEGQPSGVAVVESFSGRWKCAGCAPSYDSFVGLAAGRGVDWEARSVKGSRPVPGELVEAARVLTGHEVDVAAVDIPVSKQRIGGRRVCDNMVTKEFGRCGCGTHSPNRLRPGAIGEAISAGFSKEGFVLAEASTILENAKYLVEVYPHPALLKLLSIQYRLPYKASKSGGFWKGAGIEERKRHILAAYARILGGLKERIADIPLELPSGVKHLSVLKRYEDAIDALVCAWVGICFLEGRAKAYGDSESAIWVPR
jgi:predicted RNase H-like nuclease